MKIFPAIDLKDGRCVRLKQGKFDDVTVFSEDPSEVARKWQAAGASYIHVVDLDGARKGSAYNQEAIRKILAAVDIPIQIGGGVRTIEDIQNKIDEGASRVILGTAVVKSPDLVKDAIERYGSKIAIGIDASNGKVAVEGWEKVSGMDAVALSGKMAALGAQTIIYTDISRDGMMQGPNIQATREMVQAVSVEVIASGGVSTIEDLDRLNAIPVYGAIIGKALYQRALDLRQVIQQYERG